MALLGILSVIGIVSAIPIMIGKKMSIRLNAKQRKWWLIAHILFVIVYFSGLWGTLLLALFSRFVDDRELMVAAHGFIIYFDWFLIIPGALGSLFTGFWLAVGNWGVTKHYWVIVKWGGTIAANFFGGAILDKWVHESFHAVSSGRMEPMLNPDYLYNWKMMLIGCVLVLTNAIFLTVISYFKPWGKRRKFRRMNG